MKKNKHITPRQLHLLFILLLCLLPAVFLFCGFVLPPQYDDTFLGEMKYKLQRLENTSGKRIVIIGGSSVPFSIKSELLAKQFPEYDIVDFGLYADMGTVVMLDWAKANIHEGDIYIIMPEQHEQTLSDYVSGADVWQALDGDFPHLTLLDSSRYEALATAFPAFAARKLFYQVNGSPTGSGIYSRSSFNEYGDISYQDRKANIMEQGYNPNDLISFSNSVITSDYVDEMNQFAKYVAKRGAMVYYHFPAMNELALSPGTTKAAIDKYVSYLKDQLTFPILGSPHKSILEGGWFYDTNYHLNDSGAILYTKLMIDDLKILFQDTSKVEIPDISMPELPDTSDSPASYSDNRDADCFTYTLTDHGLLITGLTQQGQSQTELIIPGVYEDENVVGISESAFYECASLRQLTISTNIGILYDDMFHNCPNFQELILTGSPSDYSVGSNLMGNNSSLLISVPSDELDNYKRHYSWQKYDSYLTTSSH